MRLPPRPPAGMRLPRPSAPACAAALLAAVLSTTPLLPERAALAEPGSTQLLSSLFSCTKEIIKGKEELVCTQAIDDAGDQVKNPEPNALSKLLPPRSTPLPPAYAPRPAPPPAPAPAPAPALAPAPAQKTTAEMTIAEKREEQRAAADAAGERASRLAAEQAEAAQAEAAQRSEAAVAKEAVKEAAKEAERALAKTKTAELEAEGKARKLAKEEALAKAREGSGAGKEEKKAREREAQAKREAEEKQKKAAEPVAVKESELEPPARDAAAEREAGARQEAEAASSAARDAAQAEPAAKPQAAPEQAAPATGAASNGLNVMGVEVNVSPLFSPGEVKLPSLPSFGGGGGMKLSLPQASMDKSGPAKVARRIAQLMRPPAAPAPEVHLLARGYPRPPRGEPSPRGCRREAALWRGTPPMGTGTHPKLPIPIPPPLTIQAGAEAVSAIASDRRAARCATAAGRVTSSGVRTRRQRQLRRARRATAAAKGGKGEGVHAGGAAESPAVEHHAGGD